MTEEKAKYDPAADKGSKQIADADKDTHLIIDYPTTDESIAELATKYKDMTATDGNEYKAVVAGIGDIRNLRVSIEKRRVELKAPALEHGKKVDAEAKRITKLLVDIEEPLRIVKGEADAKKAKEKEERDRIEAKRIADIQALITEHFGEHRLQKLQEQSSTLINARILSITSAVIDPDAFGEFIEDAIEAKTNLLANAKIIFDNRVQHENQLKEQEKETARLADEKKKQDAESARLAEEKRVLDEQKEQQRLKQEEQDAAQKKLDDAQKALDDKKLQDEEEARLKELEDKQQGESDQLADDQKEEIDQLVEAGEIEPEPGPEPTKTEEVAHDPVDPVRASDVSIIAAVSKAFDISEKRAVSWLLDMDLKQAKEDYGLSSQGEE